MITVEKINYHISVLELTGRYTNDELSPMKKERLRIKDEIIWLKDNIYGKP